MEFNKEQRAIKALLDEYSRAARQLMDVIADLSDEQLTRIADPDTKDPACRSIQTVLAHVVSSGYSYMIYILDQAGNNNIKRPAIPTRNTAGEFINDLEAMLKFTYEGMAGARDADLADPNDTKKIKTAWGQSYDIEQIMEHAIVHILRHRRQIEAFKAFMAS